MTNITQTPAYRVAFSMYVALGGDKTRIFDSVEAIYTEIDKFYGKGSRITTEALIVNIGENGSELYNDDAITGYKPVRINVDVPQKYTDEQVEELKETSRQQGYDSGYDKGIADGYVQGETAGYTDGYTEGLEDGAEDQKALLEEITIIDNGVYEKEDGYKKVTVEIEKGIPEEELNAMLEEARNEGIETGVTTQKAKLISTSITENGTYTREDGWNSVTVKVAGGGGDEDVLPKIYNGFQPKPNGIHAEKLSLIDFSQYDWSGVYNLKEFFAGYSSQRATSSWNNFDFSNFIENYNGKIICGTNMFKPSTGSASYAPLGVVPDFSKFSSDMVDLEYMFAECTNLTNTSNLAKWDTSNVIIVNNMFQNCDEFTSITLFDTSNVVFADNMFQSCKYLRTIPEFDFSNVISAGGLLYGCTQLTTLPNMNFKKLRNFTSLDSNNPWLYNVSTLTSIGKVDCDSIINFNYFLAKANNNLTEFGGVINLGKMPVVSNTNTTYGFNYAPNLTKESVLNIINGLYDRASVGYSVLTLKLHANHLALLSEDEIAIATNKGWTLA